MGTDFSRDYSRSIRTVTDYAGDELVISEGFFGHFGDKRPEYLKQMTVERVVEIVTRPRGGVYYNWDGHDVPWRLNYFDPSETTPGSYDRLIVDKSDTPGMIITGMPGRRASACRLGDCVLEPEGDEE